MAWGLLADGSLRCKAVQPVVAFDNLLAEDARIAPAPEQTVKLDVRF